MNFTNIIVTLDRACAGAAHRCRASTVPGRRLVLAAHYESKYFPMPNHFVGATDSALPCALLLHTAEVVDAAATAARAAPTAADVTLQMIFFDGEEAFGEWSPTDSLYGARHLAARWQHESVPVAVGSNESVSVLDAIDALVLLDLLGAAQATVYSSFAETAWLHERMMQIEGELRNRRLVPVPGRDSRFLSHRSIHASPVEDDHVPFLRRGVPCVHVIPRPFPLFWHTPADNASACSRPAADIWAKIIIAFVMEYTHLRVPL